MWQLVASVWKFVALCLLPFLTVFPFGLLEMGSQELLHVRFFIVHLVPEHLVFQCPRTAVTLDGAFARIEQLAQVLIVKQPFPVEVFHLPELLARKRGDKLFVPVEEFHDLAHPPLEGIQVQRAHPFLPPVRNR